jgi:hypothetical protein
MCPRSRGPNRHETCPTGQGVWSADQPLGPSGQGFGPLGDDDFDIWLTLLCHHLKCSNLVPKFLKSNKHKNRGTRLVDKVNTWLFYTFTRYVGA